MVSQNIEDLWCYSCDNKTIHQICYMSELNFTGKLLICTLCGETVKQPVVGQAGCCW